MAQLPLPVLSGACFLVLLLNIPEICKRWNATREWIRIKGKITDFQVHIATPSTWHYSYEYSGILFSGKDVNQLQGLRGTLKIGGDVPLVVNPLDPKESFIIPPVGNLYKLFFVICFLLLVILFMQAF